MRRRLLIPCLLSLIGPAPAVQRVLAQEPPAPAPAEPAPPPPAAEEPAPPIDAEAPAPGEQPSAEPAPAPAPAPAPPAALEPPRLAPLDLSAQGRGTGEGPTLPTPSDAAKSLEAAAPAQPPAEKKGWTAPETIFHLHGYMRMRGTLLKAGWLGHSPSFDRLSAPGNINYDPFSAFLPSDRADPAPDDSNINNPVIGGCGDDPNASSGNCSKQTQVSGDLRLRLKPEIHLSDDVRVKAWIDVLDNVGAGTLGYGPNNFDSGNAIRVRRAWGEARNRDIGELRFGRMGADWGLGILDNGGDRNGIDSDFSSDVDRLMGITNLGGFYLMAAYDWASEGDVQPGSATPSGVPIDRAQNDDLDAYTFAVAHRLEQEAQQGALLRGEAVFNYGAYFIYRDQLLQRSAPVPDSADQDDDGDTMEQVPAVQPFARLDQTQYIPDLWLQFLWEGLRVELEAAFVAGTLEGGCPKLIVNENDAIPLRTATEVRASQPGVGGSDDTHRTASGQCKFRQLGVALETEYRLFDERLGIHFQSGLATGDNNAYGLAATNDPSLQRVYSDTAVGDRTISTYQFHPDYRVDLLLWRTIMRRVAGGYYFKPGVSYDFIHDPYGQLAGGRLDVIYSRASSPRQTWGHSGNLGLELDLSLYYRSEDGPDPLDGFYGLVQWGVLFPFQGLDYPDSVAGAPSTRNAMIFRGVAGISF